MEIETQKDRQKGESMMQINRNKWTLNISPGESGTRLENSNLFTCYASNHLCPIPDSSTCQITTVWTCFINRISLTSCSPCSPTSFAIFWLNIQSGMMPHSRIYSQRVASFQIVYQANRFQNMLGNMVVKVQTRLIWHGLGSEIGIEVIGCMTCEQIWILKSGIRLTR